MAISRSALKVTSLLVGLTAASLAFVVESGCLDNSTTFLCGRSLLSDNTVVQTCDRPSELCDCRTNSCATPANDCDGGYRYSEPPFAQPGFAGQCVTGLDPTWTIPAGGSGSCPLSAGAPIPIADASGFEGGPEPNPAGSEAGEQPTDATATEAGDGPAQLSDAGSEATLEGTGSGADVDCESSADDDSAIGKDD